MHSNFLVFQPDMPKIAVVTKLDLSKQYTGKTLAAKYSKQFSTGVLSKRFSENMQQIYRITPMSKSDFSNVALKLY